MKKKKTGLILNRKSGLYLKDTGAKGRGVFCTTAIKKGEQLEVTPALLMGDAATDHIDKTLLMNYAFSTGKISADARKLAQLKKSEYSCAIVMGIQSFCNHSESPNAEISWEEEDGSVYYVLEATKAIPAHTEICTSYGDDWLKDRDIGN